MATTSHLGRADALASEAWRRIAEFAFSQFQNREHVDILREMGLTPGHMKTLSILDPDEPKPMRAMAQTLSCDASMVTLAVDRLEERRLVERRPSATDRRVKTVVLTPAGIELRDRLAAAMLAPPPELLALDPETLQALCDILRTLPRPQHPFWPHRSEVADAEPVG